MKKTNVQKLIAILIIGLLMMGGIMSCHKDENDDIKQPPKKKYSLGYVPKGKIAVTVHNKKIEDISAQSLPKSVDLSKYFPPVKDQTGGLCVAWAAGYNYRTYLYAKGKGLTKSDLSNASNCFSPKDLWMSLLERYKGHDPGEECEGTNYEPILEILTSRGIATMETEPDRNYDYCNYNPEKNATEAANYKIKEYYSINQDAETIKKYLSQEIAVMFSAYLVHDFAEANGIYKTTSNDWWGYHAMVICGYDDDKGPNGAFRIINSWDTDWGDNGYLWVDQKFFFERFCTETFVAFAEDGNGPQSELKIESCNLNGEEIFHHKHRSIEFGNNLDIEAFANKECDIWISVDEDEGTKGSTRHVENPTMGDHKIVVWAEKDGEKSEEYYFWADVYKEEPIISEVTVNKWKVKNGDTKNINEGENIEIEVTTDGECEIYISVDEDNPTNGPTHTILNPTPKDYNVSVWIEYEGQKSDPFNFIVRVDKDQPNPEITSCYINDQPVNNGKPITIKKSEGIKLKANANIVCDKIVVDDGREQYHCDNQSYFFDSFSCDRDNIEYTIYAIKDGKTSEYYKIEVIIEDDSQILTPQITSVIINGKIPVSNRSTKYFDYNDEVQIEVVTDMVCDDISVDFPDYYTKHGNNTDSYKTPWFDATESGKVTITATKNEKSSTFEFYIEVEDNTQSDAPKITSVIINGSSITNGGKKDLDWGDKVQIEVTTDIECDEITIDYPNYEGDTKVDYNTKSYNTSFDAKRYGTATIVAKKNGKTDEFEFKILVYETEEASALPDNGAQKEAHYYWLCDDLVLQAAEKANFTGSYWVCTNGEDEYNRLVVHKESGVFRSDQIRLIVSTSITDLSDNNIIAQKQVQGKDNDYYIDITPTDKQLYLIVYVGGGDCGSVEIDGYYCGPFNYHYAPK